MKYFLMFTMVLALASCDKKDLENAGASLDFYYLADYKTQDSSFKIIDSTVVLADSLIIAYEDIISYSEKDYTFTITAETSEKIEDSKTYSFHKKAFAVVVDNEIIYTGYFWAGFSSLSCDWVIIDPIDYADDNTLKVRLGYPGENPNDPIPDHRNDPRILQTLKKDMKLKK